MAVIFKKLEALNEYCGRVVAWLTLAMVCVTFVIVLLRYLFNIGSIAWQESVTYMHASVFMLAAAYTFKHDAHVRVDIFYRNLNARRQAWVNLCGNIVLLLPVCGFILLSSWDYVQTAWSLKEGSREAGGLPLVYLLKSLIPLTALLLAWQAALDIIKGISTLLGRSLQEDRAP